jgi:putative ABC transport system permease protein
MKFFLLVLKNLARNKLRSSLTAVGTMVTVFVVTLVWSILAFLDMVTEEKSHNLKAIVTERWRIPSQLPFSYAASLAEGAARRPTDVRPTDSMSWQFYGGTLTPGKPSRENILFAVAMEPSKIMTMLDELDNLPPDEAAELARGVKRLELNRQGILLGYDRLKAIHREVGDRFKVYSMNYKEIDLEFEIVGMLPRGRYDNSALMNRDYLNQAIDAYGKRPGRQKHPMADKSLNLVWLRVSDRESFDRVAAQIMKSPYYSNPAVKCEMASSMISSALEPFRDLIWAMRYLLSPAALITLSLIIANAISISVRERRLELAVLKVLGFRPRQILLLVLGEALLIGTLAGLASAGLTYVIVNDVMGGLKFPLSFFGSFFIPGQAIGWGAGMGAATALLGSIVPAWSAQNVKVAEVFAKIA